MCPSIFYSLVAVDRSSADNFKFNKETEFTPILGLLASNLNARADKVQDNSKDEQTASSIQDNHHSALLSLLAEEMSVKPEEIHDFEVWVSTSLVPSHEHAEQVVIKATL
jgi:aspartyl aminopeptidase